MRKSILFITLFALSFCTNSFAVQETNLEGTEEPVRIDLYNTSKGDGVVPPYRIPGISTAHDGRLVTVAARLVCGTDPGYGQVDIVCRTSDDHGKTWSAMRDVAVGNGETSSTENYFETAFGDPAVVADRTSDEVLVIAVAGCTVYGNANTTRQNPNLIATIHSKDNGESWETPVNVTEQIYSLFDEGNPIQAAFVGGGKVFQSRLIKKDKYYRIYAAMCARPNGNRVVYSDDFGRTWHALGGAYATPAPSGDEPKCEEMPDGRVILSSRTANGRIYNIYTYENTLEGTGSWSTDVKCTFAGSGLTPGGNSTNGEMLIIPALRNNDQKEMYLALQSLPTSSTRANVGIFYKELTDMTDMNSVANLSTDWNGFHQVSTTSSAYSSMDLQADGKIGFIYEETLTSFGKRNNPVSTCFPTGDGQHNFDGFDNIYLAMDVEYITNGAYSLKKDISRQAFLQNYFNGVADASTLSEETKVEVKAAVQALSQEPTTTEIDAIYALLNSEKPADPWDGKVVTFTNVQNNATEYAIYINDNNTLAISSTSAKELGAKAEFTCKKEASGKYSFYNSASKQYMIWRASDSQNYGYNSNKGTLDTYNATYCDWAIGNGSSSKEGTFYITGKRGNDSDGTLIIQSGGTFDSWSSGIALSNTYSNLFRISEVGTEVSFTYKYIYKGEIVGTQNCIATIGEAFPVPSSLPVGVDAAVPQGTVSQESNGQTYEITCTLSSNCPVEFAEDASSITKWYYLKAKNNTYIQELGDYIKWGNASFEATYAESHMWGFVGNPFATQVISRSAGTGVYSTGSGAASFNATPTTFYMAKGQNNSTNKFCLQHENGQYLNAQSGKIQHWSANDAGSEFEPFEVEETKIIISPENNYATLYLDYKAYIPENVEAYVVSSATGTTATLEAVEGILPANTGIILKNAGEYNFITSINDETTIESNLLHGSVETEDITGAGYVLANKGGVIGFYKTELTDGKFQNKAGKAYLLESDVTAGARFLNFDFGTETAIENIQGTENGAVIYDLAGRRVQNVQKGLYIVNGKKVIK